MNKQPSFNLVDEQWIWVRDQNGDRVELSLSQLFERANDLKCLANDLPTQDFAILRILLAILQRSLISISKEYELPEDLWADLWESRDQGLPIEEIQKYLAEWRHRFDLFDDEEPFMQVAGLQSSNGKTTEITKIVADVPDGDPLFAVRSGKSLERLEFDEAARWLIHVQAFDTSGIKTGVVGDSSAKKGKSYPIGTGWAGRIGGLYLEGANLTETLMLNLVMAPGEADKFWADDDLPAWERAQCPVGGVSRVPAGPADVFTWQARRVLLHAGDGVVDYLTLTNGDKIEPQNKRQIEPMTSWRRSEPQEKKLGLDRVYMPLEHDPKRQLWRGLNAVLSSDKEDSRFQPSQLVTWINRLASDNGGRCINHSALIRMHAVGFSYGPQSSTFEEMFDDSLAFETILLSDEGAALCGLALECIDSTDKTVRSLGRFASEVVLAGGADDELERGRYRAGEARRAAEDASAAAFFELDREFREWLASLTSETPVDDARRQWYQTARSIIAGIAGDIMGSADSQSLIGRKINGEWVSAASAYAKFNYWLRTNMPIEEHFE